MTYRIDLFQAGSNFSTAFVAPDLRFSVYDVDGENPNTTGPGTTQSNLRQSEAVRIFKRTGSSGFAGYQVGSAANALIPSEETTSYLFSGRGVNQLESNTAGAGIFYFLNTSSVTFQFEANTTAPLATSGVNAMFSAIDGDVSLIGNNSTNFDSSGRATPATGFGAFVAANAVTPVPEPLTVIGSILGGTAAFRMRKKLKASNKA